jgi:hypothetical protein
VATDILKLKKSAVAAGMPKDTARTANRAALEAFLAKPRKKSTPVKKATPVRKPAAKKAAPARKAATPAKRTPARKPAAKRSAPAKAPATRKTAKRPATNGNGDAGRNMIVSLDYTNTDGWNPRAGSAVERIFRSLKKYKGNVDKVFDALLPEINDFVGTKMQDGTKRSKASKESMLRYRISRTKFDFAIKTGQHEIATERVEYGTGPYASTRKKKPARVVKPQAKRVAAKPATRRPAAKKTAARRTTRR